MTSLTQFDTLRNHLQSAIAQTSNLEAKAALERRLREARLASYRPSPRVPLADLREDLSALDDAEDALNAACANGDEPPPGALNDIIDRRTAIETEINARTEGEWTRYELAGVATR